MRESNPDVVELAKKQRHLYLLSKVKQCKLLSISEIGELEYYEQLRAKGTKRKHVE
jgi:hypothetical protein